MSCIQGMYWKFEFYWLDKGNLFVYIYFDNMKEDLNRLNHLNHSNFEDF